MPRVKNYTLAYVRRAEDDIRLSRKYEEFQHITLANLSESKVYVLLLFGVWYCCCLVLFGVIVFCSCC